MRNKWILHTASKLNGLSVTIGSNERLIVNTVKNFRIPLKAGDLFGLLGNYQLFKEEQAPWI
jgi:hypothetical protein